MQNIQCNSILFTDHPILVLRHRSHRTCLDAGGHAAAVDGPLNVVVGERHIPLVVRRRCER